MPAIARYTEQLPSCKICRMIRVMVPYFESLLHICEQEPAGVGNSIRPLLLNLPVLLNHQRDGRRFELITAE